jgi:hypothetical protein
MGVAKIADAEQLKLIASYIPFPMCSPKGVNAMKVKQWHAFNRLA